MNRFFSGAIAAIALALAAALLPADAFAADPIYTGYFSSKAVNGYDPVAYFSEGKPIEGSEEFTFEWKDATWHFFSAANRDQFKSDPEKFAPQYGGYCAYAVAHGATAPGDPELWEIVDGRLYLNLNKDIQAEWKKDIPGFIEKADANWPQVLSQ